MSGFIEALDLRVYYEDTDHGGVVYYANYLKFMERGRTEFLRTLGLDLDQIEQEHGILFAVSEAAIRYHRAARFNDLLTVESRITHLRGARIIFRQSVLRQPSRTLLAEAEIKLACIRRDGGVCRIPAAIAAILKQHLSERK